MKIGLDIGGSHISIGVISKNHELILQNEKEIKIAESKNPNEVLLNNIIQMIEDIISKFGEENIELIGISAPRQDREWKNYCCRKSKYKKYGNSKTIKRKI